MSAVTVCGVKVIEPLLLLLPVRPLPKVSVEVPFGKAPEVVKLIIVELSGSLRTALKAVPVSGA